MEPSARGQNGAIATISEIDYVHSLGHFYSAITVACGYQAVRHEGKVTGLAAYGKVDVDLLHDFERLFKVSDSTIVSQLNAEFPLGPYPHTLYEYQVNRIRKLAGKRSLPDIAATAQQFLENLIAEFAEQNIRKTNASHLLVAGGVFANVRLNQRLAMLKGLKAFQVHPAMSDAGLGLGAALECHYRYAAYLGDRVTNVFLGPEYSASEIERLLRLNGGISYCEPSNIEHDVADLLARGEIVCRFVGRMEYGPRALGNRSLLYRADDPTVNGWLNQKLNRTETMPFAPVTLDEFMDECYEVIPSARACDEFMTITYQCTDFMRKLSPGVIHLDGTARPQRVCRSNNPSLYALLSRYHEVTGKPSLINTSFNLHEEPIVCSPSDAIQTFLMGRFRFMQLGPFLVQRKNKD